MEPQFDYKESNRASSVLTFDSRTTIRKRTQPDSAFQALLAPKRIVNSPLN